MNLVRVDHTAIAVRDLDAALRQYLLIFGVTPNLRTTVLDQSVEVAFLPLGNTSLELVAPTDDGSPVARFLDKRGEGLHHIGILVEEIESELRALKEQGVQLIDLTPRRGPRGLIAFVKPSESAGVLVELVEHTDDQLLAI